MATTRTAAALLEEHRQAFREKFGREPGPGDPVFFDPDADEPRRLDPVKVRREMRKVSPSATAIRLGVPFEGEE